MSGGTVIIETLRPGDETTNCAGCFFWSRWLENTGDCMRYAQSRRERYGTDLEPLPQLSAKATSGGQVCDDHKPDDRQRMVSCSHCGGSGKVPA